MRGNPGSPELDFFAKQATHGHRIATLAKPPPSSIFRNRKSEICFIMASDDRRNAISGPSPTSDLSGEPLKTDTDGSWLILTPETREDHKKAQEKSSIEKEEIDEVTKRNKDRKAGEAGEELEQLAKTHDELKDACDVI
jgi:hypothetical protein